MGPNTGLGHPGRFLGSYGLDRKSRPKKPKYKKPKSSTAAVKGPFTESRFGQSQCGFLKLSVELRSEIYRYCSALSLLQLSHCSFQFRYELNRHGQGKKYNRNTKIIKKSPGYWSHCGNPFSQQILLRYFNSPTRSAVRCHNINLVGRLMSEEEVKLFERAIYGSGKIGNVGYLQPTDKRAVCFTCRCIVRVTDGRGCSAEGIFFCERCYPHPLGPNDRGWEPRWPVAPLK
ncbi:hypothetical protein BJ508DRAFT_311528 [Ascobolus immersus RN42]|uniref:F-box domain-containing protein n=1 Tax=Ascobolus immersus RN42 TaxID=1160509 RepID=A0A3N4HRH8_ASCIM|nr:hypothetical protein BJ508DRAFT_311528 [Ascobolus immersus RN42]